MKRRLFLVGVPRSGTTLLQSLLAAHSELTSFTESHLLSRHFSLVPPFGRALLRRDPEPRAREFLRENGASAEEAEAWCGPLAGLGGPGREVRTKRALREIVSLLDRLAASRESDSWLEKTPRHLRFVPAVEAALDPADRDTVQTIHLVRRPVETAASLYQASRSWPEPYDLLACVRRWNEDVAFTLETLRGPRQHLVLYEELCARPEQTLRSLLGRLGLSWQPELLAEYGVRASELVTAEESWKAGVERPLSASSRSLQSLSKKDVAELERSVDHALYERAYDRLSSSDS